MPHRRNSIFSDTPSPLADIIDTFDELKEDGRRYYINVEAKYNYILPSDDREKDRLLV
jgi:hypothetical protein